MNLTGYPFRLLETEWTLIEVGYGGWWGWEIRRRKKRDVAGRRRLMEGARWKSMNVRTEVLAAPGPERTAKLVVSQNSLYSLYQCGPAY